MSRACGWRFMHRHAACRSCTGLQLALCAQSCCWCFVHRLAAGTLCTGLQLVLCAQACSWHFVHKHAANKSCTGMPLAGHAACALSQALSPTATCVLVCLLWLCAHLCRASPSCCEAPLPPKTPLTPAGLPRGGAGGRRAGRQVARPAAVLQSGPGLGPRGQWVP